jgi:CDP-diacylglycerol--serine O-phosphatidyltransferase
MLKALSLEQGTFLSFFSATGAMVFSVCGVLRLARFHVKAAEIKASGEIDKELKKHFTGLPIPAAAAAAVSSNLFFLSPWIVDLIPIGKCEISIVLTCIMIVLGYFMVCRLKFPSLKILHFRIPSFHFAFFTGLIAILLLYGILHFFALVLAFLSWSYILLSLVLSVIRLIAGKKSKTLEDFEPEPEDFEN